MAVRSALLLVLALGCRFVPGLPSEGTSDGAMVAGDTKIIDAFVATDTPNGPAVRRIDITGSMVSGGPHADFPVLVAMTKPWLRGIASGGEVQSAFGYDIWFSRDAAGTSPLAHELEHYAPSAGELVAWVKVPVVSTTTSFYIHDGDPTITTSRADPPAVWSAGYAGVWHMSGITDATAKNIDTEFGTTDVTAQIAQGRGFNGAGSVISAGNAAAVTNVFATGGTAEAWIFPTSWGQNGFGRIVDKSNYTVFAMCNPSVAGALLFGRVFSMQTTNWCTTANALSLNTWAHVAVVYDESSTTNVPAIYVNGIATTLSPASAPVGTALSDASSPLTIGDRALTARSFAGTIDELRLSRVARSAGWIATCYANQLAPASFAVVAP